MSSADYGHKFMPTEEELEKLLAVPALARELHKPMTLNREYDIPYLAGYSTDGKTIYLDQHLPKVLKAGKTFRPASFLPVHERFEKALIDVFDMRYQKAHAFATLVEHKAVREARLDPAKYEAVLRPYIRECDHESIKKVPSDLDLTPYEDEHDKRILRELMTAKEDA